MTITIMEKEFENQISAGEWIHNNYEPTDNYNIYKGRDDTVIVAAQYIVEEAEDPFEDYTAYVEYCFSEKMYNETEFYNLPWETSIWGVTLQYPVVQEFGDEDPESNRMGVSEIVKMCDDCGSRDDCIISQAVFKIYKNLKDTERGYGVEEAVVSFWTDCCPLINMEDD